MIWQGDLNRGQFKNSQNPHLQSADVKVRNFRERDWCCIFVPRKPQEEERSMTDMKETIENYTSKSKDRK